MYSRGPFSIQPSQLFPGHFYVSARHEVTKTAEDEKKYGYVLPIEEHAKTLTYALNEAYNNENTLKILKEGFKRLQDTFIL